MRGPSRILPRRTMLLKCPMSEERTTGPSPPGAWALHEIKKNIAKAALARVLRAISLPSPNKTLIVSYSVLQRRGKKGKKTNLKTA